jgi:zinc transporter ZupT
LSSFGQLLFFGTLVALANVLGGWLLTRPRATPRDAHMLRHLVALGAGFMLAVIFIEVLPEVVRLWAAGETGGEPLSHAVLGAMTLLLAGYLTVHLFEHTVAPHFHFGAETHTEAMLPHRAAYTAVGALSVHAFFDGVSVVAAYLADRTAGLLVFVAILLHKVPEGFTAASITLASGRTPRQALRATFVVGAATLAGVVSIALLASRAESVIPYALPFSAGVTLYVAASDLIPEVNHMERKSPFVSIVVFAGVAFFYLLHLLLDA